MSEPRIKYGVSIGIDVLQARNRQLSEELIELKERASIAEVTIEHLEADLADAIKRATSAKHFLNTAQMAGHSDRTALTLAVGRYHQLEALCRQMLGAYGNNSVDFHRAVAKIKQFVGE